MVDPITFSELIAGDVMEGIYEAFTGIDKDGNIVPELAESWEAMTIIWAGGSHCARV